MMQLIVLAGLVAIEKHDLAGELAAYYTQQGNTVLVLDNVTRLVLQADSIGYGDVQRLHGDALAQVSDVLAKAAYDVFILTLAETVDAEMVYTQLERLRDQYPTLVTRLVALLDLRTCDCFPQTRAAFEQIADVIVMLPYDINRLIEALA